MVKEEENGVVAETATKVSAGGATKQTNSTSNSNSNNHVKREDKVVNGKVLRRADGKKKKKKKKKAAKQAAAQANGAAANNNKEASAAAAAASKQANDTTATPKQEEQLDTKALDVEYVPEELKVEDPSAAEFAGVFEAFKFREEDEDAAAEPKKITASAPVIEGDAVRFVEDEEEQQLLSKKKLRKMNRLTVAQLKQVVDRPDVVEMHDVNSADPKTLIQLKATRNTVPVPRHWCNKRKYLQGKRGIEKPPFDLPDFIKQTGITEMREALNEKEEAQGLKAKMREKVRPKMGKMDLDYQKLHDAFFRWQTKPKMSIHGDIYYESKELETAVPDRKPGDLSAELREALGMPTDPSAKPVPPPWLLHMQRFGPPPSYPNLKIPGLNAPIPPGASYGYEPGNWGKPPVDEHGNPLYGDAFGTDAQAFNEAAWEADVEKAPWGKIESEESESESEEEESSEEEEEEEPLGFRTPSGTVSEAPSGISSIGVSTPEALDLRKKSIEEAMEQTEQPTLYKIIPQKDTAVGQERMGSAHVYDITAAQPGTSPLDRAAGRSAGPGGGGVDISIDNPEELEHLDKTRLDAAYASAAQARAAQREDFSDMVAEHQAKTKAKRKKQQDRKDDKSKKFKF
ncbi:hypothetical protein PTSG_09295 [Salpingoeca rosetta]|uniref:PSP proline-rich domain-containing protein n=1 Tax=Salpingoeca rosetta (strain ATCC 50818 / BSB-021) TaxID=946362 RepID=F2UM79_SALR5|nr:uncharacterized protein PTSG_09295 [Salpingoeca rosetta]EGD78228.1 hypothetical protein PTSG_09295 [Salpingoeca rosetta]|eukprot:XP_004989551.1 hypothetical protein PTSG_09295 [Salpingoeca rosetta]